MRILLHWNWQYSAWYNFAKKILTSEIKRYWLKIAIFGIPVVYQIYCKKVQNNKYLIYCFNLSNLNFKFKVLFYYNLELALHNKIAVVKTDDIMSNIYTYNLSYKNKSKNILWYEFSVFYFKFPNHL